MIDLQTLKNVRTILDQHRRDILAFLEELDVEIEKAEQEERKARNHA